MDMPRLLIACSSHAFCDSIAAGLDGRMDVQVCHDGRQALALLRTNRHDLLLLDLMLPGMDGLAVLQTASAEGIRPQVLAALDYQSPYMLEVLSRLQVSYVILKPCDVNAVLANLLDMTSTLPGFSRTAPSALSQRQELTARALLELGMDPKWKGFACLRVGIPLFADDPAQTVTKELYWTLGKEFGQRSILIERNIRSAIHKAWQTGDIAQWRKYFPCAPNGTVPRPSNKAFIQLMSDTLFANQKTKTG